MESCNLLREPTIEAVTNFLVNRRAYYERLLDTGTASLQERIQVQEALENVKAADPAAYVENAKADYDAEVARRNDAWNHLTRFRTRYRDCRLENFEITCDAQEAAIASIRAFRDNLDANIKAGTNLVLYGTVGSGKDHLMAALLNHAITRLRTEVSIEWRNGIDISATAKKDLESSAEWQRNNEPRRQVTAISDPALSGAPLKFYAADRIYQIFNSCYESRMPLWVTINASGRKEMNELLGPAATDRMLDGAVAIHCDWPSFRKVATS